MTELKKEYTDIKNIKHKVEHIKTAKTSGSDRERIAGELRRVLTKSGKRENA